MKQDMPDISYERSMNHNYMILGRCDFFGKEGDKSSDYRTRMLLENHIPGLLPVTHRLINGESRYYYEINSLQSLDRLYDKNEIRYDELKSLLSGCVNLFERLEEYLLDGTQIIIKPEYIYINVEKMEPYFVCYPDYEGDVRLSFMEFIDGLLTKIDHTDERAVMLGYQVYRYTRNPNYVISEIRRTMEHVIVEMVQSGTTPPENNDVPEKSFSPDNRPVSENIHMAIPGSEGGFSSGICSNDGCGEEPEVPDGKSQKHKNKATGDLIGGIFCILVSLCAGAVITGAGILNLFRLSADNELYLYGAIAMALMAAVLFFSCYIRKRKQDKELEGPGDDEEADGEEYGYQSRLYSPPPDTDRTKNSYSGNDVPGAGSPGKKEYGTGRTNPDINNDKYFHKSIPSKPHNETACLGDSVVEERMLCGRMNGREVSISLNRLPMTVGKLANVSDFVINDITVSKMHARFEEHDGRVCVCDLNSTNGTVRNGVLLGINESAVLEPGDRIRFGRTSFTYC